MDLTGHLLIAMPTLADPNFHRTVTYLCAHSEEGAMGLVINRPTDLKLADMLGQMEIPATNLAVTDMPVLQGGPVSRERGFVLHQPAGDWEATLRVSDQIGVATSRDILSEIAEGRGPCRSLVALGYAGWGAGQLEQEVLDNAWLSGPGHASILFDTPYEERWESAARLLGIDPGRLSSQAGHA